MEGEKEREREEKREAGEKGGRWKWREVEREGGGEESRFAVVGKQLGEL